MGLRCFLVLVLIVHSSLALECVNVFNSKTTTCDECIRCDGIWCKDPNMPESAKQCKSRLEAKDYWCPDEREHKYLTVEPNSQVGQALTPNYEEVLAEINKAARITLIINGVPGHAPAYYEVLNTTQISGESKVEVKLQEQFTKGSFVRRLDVTTTVHIGFCSPNSTKSEYVFVKVGLQGVAETALLKYHVPCACGCSGDIQDKSPTCSGAGSLTCGSCQCNEYTFGRHCEKNICRGDIESSSCKPGSSNDVECSGNGKCDHCGVCHCYTNNTTIQGSQYFVPEDNCQDICTTVNKCDECLVQNELGACESCVTPYVTFLEVDVSLLDDEVYGRKIWVNCSVTLDCGVVEYAVSKKDNINVMVLQDCVSKSEGVVGTGKVTIPVVIGVIAALAAMVAAAAGYAAWKGKGALPTAGSNYANIEPEDSVGVNPLYKPPTSSFKNPMFGKS